MNKRHFLAQTFVRSGSAALFRWCGSWQGLLVLNYHRIGDPARSEFDWDLWSARQEEFDWQVDFLKKNFDIVTPADLDASHRLHKGQHVLITFDDGYRDNYELAFPVLKQHGVPATIFLTTGFLDQPQVAWWDDIAWMVRHAQIDVWPAHGWSSEPISISRLEPQLTCRKLLKIYKSLHGEQGQQFLNQLGADFGCGRCPAELARDTWLTWDMVREMRSQGITFGAHTVTHPILAQQSDDTQAWEIAESQRRLSVELREPVEILSFPVGGPQSCNQTTLKLLDTYDIRWAFRFGIPFDGDYLARPLEIPRVAVEWTLDRDDFQAMLAWPQVFA